ncbi:MAG: inositol 2-dehydrogenase [Myxococcales bacterium]|nr:inositol 2-dehydrogenase [Myxococcales bacterium]
MSNVRIGVIGAGRIGQLHAENVAFRVAGAELVCVFDPDADAAARCAARCHGVRIASDARRVIEDPQVDAVMICSPTPQHAEQIEQAAAAGKHIFCEKPIALDLARIDSALAAVERAGVKLQIGFNRRFDPGFRRAREAVAAGTIGELHLVRITSRDPAPPPAEYVRASGGMFVDMTIHDFDMARWVAGREVERIYAAGAVLVDPAIGEAGDIDTALLTLRYQGGALGSIDNSRQAVYGYDQRVEVFGSEGSVVVGNATATRAVLSTRDGVSSDKPLFFFVERYAEAYVAELSAFVRCIDRDETPEVTGADGRAPVVLAQAALRSMHEGREVEV